MATEKWIAGSGVGLTWTACFGSEVNSLASGNAVQSSVVVSNASSLDIFADVSISLGSAAFVAPNYIGVYLYPLNQDGTTYGDGKFGTTAAGPPASTYWAGNIVIPAVTAVAVGTLRGIVMPPGSFKFTLYNQGGVALAASANTVSYRTYNRQIA